MGKGAPGGQPLSLCPGAAEPGPHLCPARQLDEAIAVWRNVRREDNPEAYAAAQNNLGSAYEDKELFDDSFAARSRVLRSDSPYIYAVAQLNMGIAYYNNGSLDEAVTAWNRVLEEDDPQSYAEAQRNLALVNKH